MNGRKGKRDMEEEGKEEGIWNERGSEGKLKRVNNRKQKIG